MKIPPLLSRTMGAALATGASLALTAGVLTAPTASSALQPAAPAVASTASTLPDLGFSLNGKALSGPVSPAHYRTLSEMSPGTVWARVGFNGDGDWRKNVDEYLGPIRQAGMKVLLRASFRGAVYNKKVPLNAAEQARYGDFVRDLAHYVKTKHGLTPDDVVFEHPNESNGLVSGADYAAAAKNAYPKLKAVDPGFKIIGASENVYASNWKTWLQDVYKAGYAKASDGVSFHNYDPQGDRSKYDFLESLMKQHGHWPAMVWLTEFGTTTVPGAKGNGSAAAGRAAQSEAGQATRITSVLSFLRDEVPWITHAFVYADEDIPSRKSSDRFEAHFGIFANDSQGTITREKPAVQAIRNLYASTKPADARQVGPAPVVTPTPAPAPTPAPTAPMAPKPGATQTLASFSLTSAAPTTTGSGVTVSPVTGVGFRTAPTFADFSPAYGRKVLQTNPSTTSPRTDAAYVETVLTASTPSSTVRVESIQFKATRGGDAQPRGLVVVAVVDGVAKTVLTQSLPTQRPRLTPFSATGLGLEGKEVRIRVYPYSPVHTATVEMTDLAITGRVNG
ncbi:glycosyl hydrolase [Microbacterium limosum]|uniref:Glycosyl hydrolase n=1 Tax=Microbacterium limosum TaxID=3079935 RepID=A0AAU0MI77_9MICO|nr:glycosyl hydrolase [Microbacterium sp. Y20]WOQ70162.1 glycosyl hydrolase [Microbacterium sp. Y20]